jgi:hypothetical protein
MTGGVSGCLLNPEVGQTLDAKAIVIDPQVPADIRRELERAPRRRLVPFGAPPPDVVPARRRRRGRVLTPQGRKAVTTTVTMAAFLAATITSFVLAAQTQNGVLGLVGILTMIVWIKRLIVTGWAVDLARSTGWRQPRPTADPGHPAWEGLHAVTAYHRRYVSPRRDTDAQARAVWARVVDAATKLRESKVVRLGLVDSVQVATVLPYHLWDIAERLAQLSALRVQHKAILRGVDADDPDVATLLAPQQRAQEAVGTDIERRVRQLEVFAELVGQADAARRRERAVRKLSALNDSHAELLAHIGQNTGHDALTEQMTVDVQAIIAQADEAVRQANEVGRSLVLPQRHGLD